MSKPLVEVRNLRFSYFQGEREVPILNGLNFDIQEGEFVAIQGSSGSGKSTLLYLLGGMNKVQSGEVRIAGLNISDMESSEAALFRNRFIGFIFQQFHLLPRSTVLENVLLPSRYPLENPAPVEESRVRAEKLLTELGLSHLKNNGPQELSGGQQQRVAVARALLNDAPLILADEPTGNLDSTNAEAVVQLLKEMNERGKTVILITHDPQLAKRADRVITLKDGAIVSNEVHHNKAPTTPVSNLQMEWQKLQDRMDTSFSASYLQAILGMALGNLFKSRLRSWLTMMGVSIGIAAILTTLTLGEFTKDKILSSYAELGIRTLRFFGYPNWDQKATDITKISFSGFRWENDLESLPQVFPEVKRISPSMTSRLSAIGFGGKSVNEEIRLVGINEHMLAIANLEMDRGSPITRYHVDSTSGVCLVGSEVVDRLFKPKSPIGEILSVSEDSRSFNCKIIGTLRPRSTRSEWRNPNLEVYVPFTYFMATSAYRWNTRITDVFLEVSEDAPIEMTGNNVRAFFERRYGKSGRFRVDSDSLLIEQMNRFLNVFSGFLAALAVVSLAVGGIGITNMMLVSISERFREIGLRKALGATDLSLRWQLLSESILLCGLAGVIGVVFGFSFYQIIIWGATKLIPKLAFEWVFVPWAFIFSFVSILLVGILSGVIPALRAEKLTAMEALRYE